MDELQAPSPLPKPHRRQAVRREAKRQHWRFYSSRPDWAAIQNFARAPVQWRNEHHVVAALAVLVGFLAFVVVPAWSRVIGNEEPIAIGRVLIPIPLPPDRERDTTSVSRAYAPDAGADESWRSVTIARGQTMGSVFASLGLPASQLSQLLERSTRGTALSRIRPGQQFDFRIDPSGRLDALRFAPNDEELVTLDLSGSEVKETSEARPLQRRIEIARGTISHSLFGAADVAGLSEAVVLKMVDIFGYDIDFARDLRKGDQFALVYERLYQDGEYVRDGAILGALFINDGQRTVAIRHRLPDGNFDYFDPEGRSLRRAFLRTPVEFSRISSGFSLARMHPILGRMRAHRGVDYAAPIGTPVRAAGAGRVRFRGRQSGYGNVIIIEHGGRHTTLYAHLSRFAQGIAQGRRVRQGETIGYVGMTGLATGPHLHYEFRIDGTHRDPLTVDLPRAEPLSGSELLAFRRHAEPLLEQLGQIEALLAQRS